MYKRVLIKLSGEALGDETQNYNITNIRNICETIKRVREKGIEVGIVVGGGNWMRGRDCNNLDRVSADYVGMLGTVMNAIIVRDVFTNINVNSIVQTNLEIPTLFPKKHNLIKHLKDNIIIFGGGTGKPFFSTDTASALMAKKIKADAIIKLTNVDGIYDDDPKKNKNAKLLKTITYQEALDKNLKVMDKEAFEICMKENINIIVLNIHKPNDLFKSLEGEDVGSRVL